MDKTYFLNRARASAAMARQAQCSRSRLAHFDLAGRYSVLAAGFGGAVLPNQPRAVAAPALLQEDGNYYAQLEEGARFLASRSTGDTERSRHLSMANHYVKLRLGTGGGAQ